MKVIHNVIVKAEQQYNNDVNIGGINITVNTSKENVEFINRKVTVVAAPDFTILKEGDELIIHHNILRLRNGVKGEKVESNYWIEDDLYYVPLTEVFMYRRDDNEWKALSPYCFVKPIKSKKADKIGSLYVPDNVNDKDTYKGRLKNVGILSFINQDLIDMGLKIGDKIVFSKNSEYEFNIEGELYYKMSTNDIIGKFE